MHVEYPQHQAGQHQRQRVREAQTISEQRHGKCEHEQQHDLADTYRSRRGMHYCRLSCDDLYMEDRVVEGALASTPSSPRVGRDTAIPRMLAGPAACSASAAASSVLPVVLTSSI